MAIRPLDDYICAELFEDSRLCHVCGIGTILPDTKAGRDFGVCQSCYRHAENQARIGRLHDLKAEREYQNVRKAFSNAKIPLPRIPADELVFAS